MIKHFITTRKHHAALIIAPILCCLLLTVANAASNPIQRTYSALSLIKENNWKPLLIKTNYFVLQSFIPKQLQSDVLTVYIEGDGHAWDTPFKPSKNPTPKFPLALKLALQHPDQNAVAYLGRPCQYIPDKLMKNCYDIFWTDYRFSEEVVNATIEAIDELKQQSRARRIHLVGYSGGGAIASLVAARRHDVDLIVTVAGNLDHPTWVQHHHLTPLYGSLNPTDEWFLMQDIPQVHFAGSKDEIIPLFLLQNYIRRFPPWHRPRLVEVEGFNHSCCWENRWQELYTQFIISKNSGG